MPVLIQSGFLHPMSLIPGMYDQSMLEAEPELATNKQIKAKGVTEKVVNKTWKARPDPRLDTLQEQAVQSGRRKPVGKRIVVLK